MIRPLALIACLASCAGVNEPNGSAPPLLEALPRALSSGEEAAIVANNDLAFRLTKTVAAGHLDNVFVSPLSISMALGMVLNGARGETRDSIAATLGFGPLPQAQINASVRSLLELLLGLDRQVEFSIANSLWARQGMPIKQSFLDEARQYFQAETRVLDFSAPTAAKTIDAWVSEKTKGKIPSIVETIDPDEILFAINAIYFKGLWREQFKRSETAVGTFHAASGTAQQVPFMHRLVESPYGRGPNLSFVDLWYGAGAHTMTIVLPNEGISVDQVLRDLSGTRWATLMQPLRTKVDLYLPRIRLEYKRSLKNDLIALGMGIAFEGGRADLRGIADDDLAITRVDHKTFVEVNEEGTEAAAATNVGIGVVSLPQQVTFRVDRPFVIVIRERFSGTIFFIGRIGSIPTA